MYNLLTSTEIPFRTESYFEGGVVISGNYIVWQDERNNEDGDIYMYNLLTSTEVPISTAPGRQREAAISGNYIVWQDDRHGNLDIYMYKPDCPIIDLYGENAQEVKVLRDFRDKVLASTPEGRKLISLYNDWSPVIVKAMEEDVAFKKMIKGKLDMLLSLIKEYVE
jgi:beta propeller repeat protein